MKDQAKSNATSANASKTAQHCACNFKDNYYGDRVCVPAAPQQ